MILEEAADDLALRKVACPPLLDGIEPGPLLGSLLEAIAEAQYCGTVSDQAAAVELARTLIAADS